MDLDKISLLREELLQKRQKLIHDRIRGRKIPGSSEKYLSIRDQEALLVYEELKTQNQNSPEAKVFDRPRTEIKPNRRLRIWVNLLMIAMVLAVVFFSVFTPRLTPTHGDAVEDLETSHSHGEFLP